MDKDTRLVVIIAILIVIVLLIGGMMFYFRKKENDALFTLFRLEDRINQIERKLQDMHQGKPPPAPGQ